MDPMSSYSWLIFALGTVVTWGLYGIFLHMGQIGMADPVNGRYKAFLFVGVAYFLTAVLAPLAMLMFKGSDWSFPAKGLWLSLFAGILGAIGAFFVLLALGAAISAKIQNAPGVVMSIIFAGAPIVNAIVSISMAQDWGKIRWPFILGLFMAAAGGYLVTKFKPVHAAPAKPADKVAVVESASPGSSRPSDSTPL
jgi:drug/metabolite transporter (DMT)-like permease